MMASSIFGAKQRISKPLSALAVLTGRHMEKNTRDLNFCQKSTSQRNQRVNDIAQMVNCYEGTKVSVPKIIPCIGAGMCIRTNEGTKVEGTKVEGFS